MFSPKIQRLRLIHWALVVPLVFLAIAFSFIVSDSTIQEAQDKKFIENLKFVPMGILMLGLLFAPTFMKNYLKNQIQPHDTVPTKFAIYQSGHIIKMAFFEFAGLAAIVVYFLSGHYFNLLILLGVIIVFMVNKPRVEKIEVDLGLGPDEKKQLRS